jgi:multicomponent Na+:H+ antiporter subunit E
MALLWFGLNGTDWNSWIVGVPAVLAAAWISAGLISPNPRCWSLRGLFGFAWFFLRESVLGGWDVARSALSPKLRLDPAIFSFELRLPAGPPQLFFCSVVSLLPGTAVVAIEGTRLAIHALHSSTDVETELRNLERRVAALFRCGLQTGKEVGE